MEVTTTEATGPDRQYLSFLAQGKFMLQRSRRGGRPFFYPRVAEPGTGDIHLEWVEATGLGTVHATTRVRVRPPEADYNVAVIELDDGPRMLSRVEGIDAADVAIGLRVAARIVPFEDHHTVVFTPFGGDRTEEGTRS
ncbi:Zn-ribbon domain-containing OB-fold protein [Sphingomonas panacis]|nr:OB-fold domain-containing protein [Sphingomonas panacis]